MNARMKYMKQSPGAIKAMSDLELYLQKCGLERSLLHLVKLRAPQINGWNRFSATFRVPSALKSIRVTQA
jgi:hypothetical protein